MIQQVEITLPSMSRGYYLITQEVIKELPVLPKTGLLHLFLLHTSAGLSINENADSSVRRDFEHFFNHLVPERMSFVEHDLEGPDDMPAHIKSSLVGCTLVIPIKDGGLYLGSWQGIYLCEFRNRPHSRKLIASILS